MVINAAPKGKNLAAGKGAVQNSDGSKSLGSNSGPSRSNGGPPKQDPVDRSKKVNP